MQGLPQKESIPKIHISLLLPSLEINLRKEIYDKLTQINNCIAYDEKSQ